ncbi:uncharacterized skeletal organic matrix protein 5-like [Montipora capricornis]|uniref:uncharacterized skeletal organic matrix protein 5-like n=1 Tax=Montipora capricornis TaxID=246305 RepID=UPI0035F1DF7C
MRLLFAACFGVALLILAAIHSTESGTCDKTNVCPAIKALEMKLETLIALVTPVVNPPVAPASSCKELYDKQNLRVNKAYVLQTGSGKIPVYCHMNSRGIGACGGGGWTLVMKIDGHKQTFHYNSQLWANKNEFNRPGGKTGFDFQQTKLPTYWNTPFSKICLGMKIGHQIKFMVINRHATSLYSLIADGRYRSISLGRNTWKTLIGSQASLQTNCNKEGFNAVGSAQGSSRARIGFLGNNENDCVTSDSRIGFGTGGYHDDSNTCGNEAVDNGNSDNGGKHIKAMGYILVH